MAKSAADVLREGIDWMHTHPWVGGEAANGASEAVDEYGRVCLATSIHAKKWTPCGALKKVCNDALDDYVGAYSWLKLIVREKYGVNSLFDWNTSQILSEEEAIQDMRLALTRAELNGRKS